MISILTHARGNLKKMKFLTESLWWSAIVLAAISAGVVDLIGGSPVDAWQTYIVVFLIIWYSDN